MLRARSAVTRALPWRLGCSGGSGSQAARPNPRDLPSAARCMASVAAPSGSCGGGSGGGVSGGGGCTYKWPRPALTVDAAIVARGATPGSPPRLLLIQRKHAPCRGQWALPGGFVDEGEVGCARRSGNGRRGAAVHTRAGEQPALPPFPRRLRPIGALAAAQTADARACRLLPQGLEAAAARELKEETGLDAGQAPMVQVPGA